jgi:hypothetical protein
LGEGDREGGVEVEARTKRGREWREDQCVTVLFRKGAICKICRLASEPGRGRLVLSAMEKTNSIGFLRARLL